MRVILTLNLPLVIMEEIYERHYKTIKTRIQRGKLKTIYHFLVPVLHELSQKKLTEQLQTIISDIGFNFKVNVGFGVILQNVQTEEFRFFNPSYNNLIFDRPKTVSIHRNLEEILKDLKTTDIITYSTADKPSTAWEFVKVICVRYDVYKITIGTS